MAEKKWQRNKREKNEDSRTKFLKTRNLKKKHRQTGRPVFNM